MTLERIRAGDEGALEELLHEVWPPLVRHLTAMLASREAAEDAAQEAFVRLWERRERWEAGSPRALLFRIGRNVALDEERRRGVRDRVTRGVAGPGPSVASAPDEDLHRSEVRGRIAAAVERLPPRRREVFELVRLAGLSYGEAAQAMGLSPQTVANHMSLALTDLRADLADLVASEAPEPPGCEGRRRDG